jgi:hypothetical protein
MRLGKANLCYVLVKETSQPNRDAIEYWALGLEPIYLEGALARAQGRLP